MKKTLAGILVISMARMKKLLCLALVFCAILSACGQNSAEIAATWQDQYDLGVRYLEEGNYEEAIIAFSVAIEIDSKRSEAYIGLANAYIALGNPEMAKEALLRGIEKIPGDTALQALLDGLATSQENLRDLDDIISNNPERLFEKPVSANAFSIFGKPFWEWTPNQLEESYPELMANQPTSEVCWLTEPYHCQFETNTTDASTDPAAGSAVRVMFMTEKGGIAGIEIGMGVRETLIAIGCSEYGVNAIANAQGGIFSFDIDKGMCNYAKRNQAPESAQPYDMSIWINLENACKLLMAYRGGKLAYMQLDGLEPQRWNVEQAIRDGSIQGELVECDLIIFTNRLVSEYEDAYQASGANGIMPFGVRFSEMVTTQLGDAGVLAEAELDYLSEYSAFLNEELFSPEETPANWKEAHGSCVDIPLHAVGLLTYDQNFSGTYHASNDLTYYQPNGPYRFCVISFEK